MSSYGKEKIVFMIKLVPFLLTLTLIVSCIDDVDNVEEQFPQQWQLVRMTGQSGNTHKTGSYLDWNEFYLLNPDGRFLKSRLDDGVKTSATGNFSIQETEEVTLVILTFDEDSEIIGNCDDSLTETLRILTENIMVGTWSACDGPGLEYFRSK
jgi:hypothetical protein